MRSRARKGYDSLSINVLELFGMVWTVCVIIVIRKDLPGRAGEAVLLRGDNSSACLLYTSPSPRDS